MLNLSSRSVEAGLRKEKLHAIRLVGPPKAGKVLTKILWGFLILFGLIMFVPWQQNIDGQGQLTALDPQDRPQTIQSPIAGRIDRWYVQEGQFVKKGDTIIVLSEIKEKFLDPDLLPRLQEQVGAKQKVIQSTFRKAEALEGQISALNNGLLLKLKQAENKVIQARLKVRSDSTDLSAEQQNFSIADTQLTLGRTMYNKGIISLTDFQRRQEKFQQATAKLISQENKLLDAKNGLINAQIELNAIRADYMEKTAKAESERNSTLAYVAEAEGDLAKLENEYSSMLMRNTFYTIKAPQDGYVVKAIRTGIGENIKEGEAVITILPSKPKLAAELYVRPMDVPLLEKGQKVRIQFDGWPAFVFSGWQSASVGTFAGIISNIDAVESNNGKFRVLVIPDPAEDPWPDKVRIGSGIYGWAMLQNVPVWYELWRQLNGFPPEFNPSGEKSNSSKSSDKGVK